MPDGSTAVAMQAYVSSWTKHVVTGIKSSVETTIDRISNASGQTDCEQELDDADTPDAAMDGAPGSALDAEQAAAAVNATLTSSCSVRLSICLSALFFCND